MHEVKTNRVFLSVRDIVDIITELESKRLLNEIYQEAKQIYESRLSWGEKYHLIFSERISKQTSFSWCDPDTSYKDDVTAYMDGFDYYMVNQND